MRKFTKWDEVDDRDGGVVPAAAKGTAAAELFVLARVKDLRKRWLLWVLLIRGWIAGEVGELQQ